MNTSTSAELWPVHLKPKDDELLSSWLVRLARGHGIKPHSFCHLAWPGKAIWNRDIDKCADQEVLSLLSKRTAVSEERVFQTTLRSYEGVVSERHNPNGHSRWILPVGVYHRNRTRFGMQYCPLCLAEDKHPHFRKRWRLGFVAVCATHGCRLLDRCQVCEGAVSSHRNSLDALSLAQCSTCGVDLRKHNVMCDNQSLELVLFKTKMINAIKEGCITLPQSGYLHAHLFFTGLYKLVSLLACERQGRNLRTALQTTVNFPQEVFSNKGQRVEPSHMGVEARFYLLSMANWLLQDWPNRFVDFCQENSMTSSDLLRDMQDIPFWYEQVIKEHFYRPKHGPTVDEIKAAVEYLRQSGEIFNGRAVSRLLGVTDVFRDRPELRHLLETPDGL